MIGWLTWTLVVRPLGCTLAVVDWVRYSARRRARDATPRRP